MEQKQQTTTVDQFQQELRLFDGPFRWLFWAGGLAGIWIYQQGNLSIGSILGLLVYLGLNILLIPLLARVNLEWRPYLAVGLYISDLLFASFLIYHTGGLVSQLFLLYCLLVFKAAIYFPFVYPFIFVPFLIFPLYVATLFLGTGTMVFIQEQLFVSRYILLFVVILVGMYTAWHLDSRHRETRELLRQLELEHRRLDERRRELRAVLDSIGDGVIVVNPQLQLLMINPVAANIFNLAYPQPFGVQLDALVQEPKLLTLLRHALRDTNSRGEMIWDEINAHPISSGKPIVCEALATALVRNQDTPHGAVVVLRDLTRLKELEESKTNFISMLSHELRTPLTAIRGFLELILSGDTGAVPVQQREFLEIAVDQSEQLGSLIDALLEFAEIEASEARLTLQSLSIHEMVHNVLSLWQPAAMQRHIDLETDIPPDIPPIYADGRRLERVLLNLLDNAIKFTPDGGTIAVSVSDQESRFLFCVTDTGPGIPLAERERVFERFYQIDYSSTRKHGGTGLGLSVCQHIVEMHNGQIWVEAASNHSTGSRFCFTIPRDLEYRRDLQLPPALGADSPTL